MKTRILPVLLLWALFGASDIANAQLPTRDQAPDSAQPQPPVTNTGPNGNGGAPLTQAGLSDCGGNCACAASCNHGSCWQKFTAWLCYKALPVPPCACQRVCNYEYYPRLCNYFLHPAAFIEGGSPSPGCQNCGGNR